MATIIKGKEVAEHVLADVRAGVDALLARGITPCLAVILVGDDPASEVYVRKKKEKCEELGIRSLQIHLPAETTQQELLARVEALNADPSVLPVQVPPVLFSSSCLPKCNQTKK